MSVGTDVAIIGAGPYGLSIAAHLSRHNVAFRIFGTPMSTWRNHMAGGTYLKSFGFASCLYDPDSTFTLERFCQENGLAYSDSTDPVALDTFINYGLEFQRRFVPEVENTDIASVERAPKGFLLKTASGEQFAASRVIVAAGITHFHYTPPLFDGMPKELVSHSSEHTDVLRFKGQRVAVLGAGASAADLAGLLHEAGAETHLIARRDSLNFNAAPGHAPRSLSQRILRPSSGLGHGLRGKFYADLPLVFHALPSKFRHYAFRTVNGPAPCWFAKEKVVGLVTMHLGTKLNGAHIAGTQLTLDLAKPDGSQEYLQVDHMIAATGYRIKLERLSFLRETLVPQIRTNDDMPVLDMNFQSSVKGLYLVGVASAPSFGPLFRFACGAQFTARRIARHLASQS